ncbi:MAG: YutD-like domain-containing protein [Bacillota bacterium]
MLETNHGNFEIIKDYREALEVAAFNERYVDYLDKYDYIVGDYSSEMLRFKGFTEKNKHTIPDYLMESCVPNAPYFVLKRIKSNAFTETKNND